MKIRLQIIFLFLFCVLYGTAQEKIYKLDTKKDIFLTGVGIGLNVIGYSLNTEGPILSEINALDGQDLWGIDRSAIYNDSNTAEIFSDVILYSSMSLPLVIYSDKICRFEGLTVGLMGFETFLITNGITSITKASVERYRPFNYNPNVSEEKKLSERSRRSFFSGHTSVTTALSFFTAKVITDLRPTSRYKWLVWTVGATAPALVGYLRYEAGKHFFTDVVTGYAVGAVIGYMVPAMHLNKNVNVGIGMAGTLDFRITF